MNLVQAFQMMKRVYGFCPCCGELFRLSDAELFTRGAPPKTPFDRAREAQERIERKLERFEDAEAQIRAKHVAAGQRAARKRLKKIAPAFAARGVDVQDVKVLFDPIDYVAFRGLNSDGGVRSIELMDRAPDTSRRERVQTSIQKALRNGNVEWKTYRIDGSGLVAEEDWSTPRRSCASGPGRRPP